MSTTIDTTTIQYPTQYSSQRKLVKTSSGTLVLFSRKEENGAIDIKYKVSSDNGATWGSWINAYSCSGDTNLNVNNFDIYLDINDDILLTWHRTSGSSIFFRKLVNNGDDTWTNGTEYTVRIGNIVYCSITRRSNGDIYIGARHFTQSRAWVFNSIDEGLNWTLILDHPAFNCSNPPDIIPQGTDIWDIVRYNNELLVHIYNGSSWSTTVIANDLPASGGDVCALKVSDTEIYAATSSASGIKLYTYTGTWDSGILMSDNMNDSQPTLALIDTYLVLAWRDYDGSNYNIYYRKKITASWGNETPLTNDSIDDSYPTLIENGSSYAPIIWSRGDSSPYSIMFESITIVATEQLTPSLEWVVSRVHQLDPNPQLQWVTKIDKKFCPNLINFDFKQDVPSISEYKVPITTYGCLYAYGIYMKNTGSSGQTEIEVYINSILKKTITIVADNNEYSDVYYFGLTDELDILDTLSIKITEVATNSEQLLLNLYEMSFPFKIDSLMLANMKDNYIIRGLTEKYIFSNADYWIIEMNQPVNDINFIKGLTNDNYTGTLQATVTDGFFKNSRIKITSITDATITKLILSIKDVKGENFSFEIPVIQTTNFANLTDFYSESSASMDLYIAASHYKYSFDGGTIWSDWNLVSNNSITLDFSLQSEGTKNLVIKYRLGTKEFTDTKNIQYLISAIDCSINFTFNGFQLFYTDSIPLQQVEIYGDDNLLDTLTPISFFGFNSVILDANNKTITMNNGTLYYDSQKYEYTSTIHNIVPDISESNIKTLIFVFNKGTRDFEWLEQDTDISSELANAPDNCILLYYISYAISAFEETGNKITFYGTGTYIPMEATSFDSINYSEIVVRVKDTAGRSRDFTRNFYKTQYSNVWRTITVKNGSDNIVKQGQIHFNTNLTFTVNLEDIY